MIHFTDNAIKHLKYLQSNLSEEDTGKTLRLWIQKGGCAGKEYAMSFDTPQEGDSEQIFEGFTYLIARDSLEDIEGSHIDHDGGLQGKGFKFKNPRASKTCGCGKSFR